MTVWLTPSRINDWQSCPRSVWFSMRYRSVLQDWSLGFGSSLHETMEHFLLGNFHGFNVNVEKAFCRAFDRLVPASVTFPKRFKNRDEVRNMGILMAQTLADRWTKLGMVLLHRNGEPLIEISHQIRITHNVMLSGRWDFIAWSRRHGITVVDLKSCAAFTPDWFTSVSPQLSCYILLAEDYLGDRVDSVGFLEAKKNKQLGAVELSVSPRHSDQWLEQFRQQVEWIAEDIEAGRFPAHPRMAFNSPCGMCDFQSACHFGKFGSLIEKRPRNKALA